MGVGCAVVCKKPLKVTIFIAVMQKVRSVVAAFPASVGDWFRCMASTQLLAASEGSGGRRWSTRSGLWLTLMLAGGLAAQTTQAPPAQPGADAEESQKSSPNAAEPAELFTVEGKVKSGSTLIPGATVSATNPATKEKVVGWTRADGSYTLALPAAGAYEVRVQMAGFAVATQHVSAGPANPHPQLNVEVTLLSRAQSAAEGAYARGGAAGTEDFSRWR